MVTCEVISRDKGGNIFPYVIGILGRKKEKDRKVFGEILTKKISKFEGNYKPTDLRRSTNPKKD